MNFEKLKNMETFTTELFDQIVSFQEKEHPAWDNSLSFDQRIKNLPLHSLIFSNPDRDPALFGPTIAFYHPLHGEMHALAHYALQVAEHPIVCDVHGGNGFIATLFAKDLDGTGAQVFALQDDKQKPNQIESFYDPQLVERLNVSITALDRPFDVALSSWMPAEQNYTPDIVQHQPKLIIFIYTEHQHEKTGGRQTGTQEAYENLPENYKLIDEWDITRPQDLFHSSWPDLTPNMEEVRKVKVYAAAPYHDIKLYDNVNSVEPYYWETELDMALTAIEARSFLHKKGITADRMF